MAQPCVFVVEDEAILTTDLCDTVAEAGFKVAGPHSNLSSAMRAFRKRKPDVAILDVQLNDGKIFPIARKLADQKIPIIFHSGLAADAEVQARFPNATTLPKPCPPAVMIAAVNQLLHIS